jgi:hypothetical protein
MKTTFKISVLAASALLMSFSPESKINRPSTLEISTFLKTSITWKSTEINLGEIVQNKPVSLEFEFINTGENPVIIFSVQASCGCTSTDYSKTPILPGESTKIKAVYNAAAKGAFKKQVTVITNAEENPKTLTFTGTVI